jgi:hypothetical protein
LDTHASIQLIEDKHKDQVDPQGKEGVMSEYANKLPVSQQITANSDCELSLLVQRQSF